VLQPCQRWRPAADAGEGPMSHMGQIRTSQSPLAMSAIPPKAEVQARSRHVRNVPTAAVSSCSKSQILDANSSKRVCGTIGRCRTARRRLQCAHSRSHRLRPVPVASISTQVPAAQCMSFIFDSIALLCSYLAVRATTFWEVPCTAHSLCRCHLLR
jgi:hypothetical protein